MKHHELNIRVYYEDTDAAGIVYYANYLKFAERGRTEHLRSLGFENKSLRENEGLAFVVRHIEADFYAPATLDDCLTVETEVIGLKNASFVMKQGIFCENKHLFDMKLVLVCVNKAGKPVKLPENMQNSLIQCRG